MHVTADTLISLSGNSLSAKENKGTKGWINLQSASTPLSYIVLTIYSLTTVLPEIIKTRYVPSG